jgi:hypothetical protein
MADQQLSYGNFIDLLLQKVPELRPLRDEHIRQYDELLPHVFFGELTRYVIDQVRAERDGTAQGGPEPVARILDFLERAMISSDTKVQELVSVSFLENLDQSDEAYAKLKALLGPTLKRELASYER